MKHNFTIRLLAFVGLLFTGIAARAQLVNCNVFLQGHYIEVGTSWNGAFGSSTGAPAGYHPRGASAIQNSAACGFSMPAADSGLGFVVDPAMDGWSVGSPAYFGDFFMPGVPQEGWSFMCNGKQVNEWNEDAKDSAMDYSIFHYQTYVEDSSIIVTTYWYDSITMVWDTLNNFGYDTIQHYDTTYYAHGANIGYDTVGNSLVGTWQGMFDSVAITQITTLNMDSLYFSMQVIMTNLSTSPKDNVYYLRTVDPDNDQPESGEFTTFNKVEYQLPNPSGITVVSARGTVYSDAYLALGSADPRAKCFICRSGLYPSQGTLATMFAGDTANYLYGSSDTLISDVGINLAFKIGHLASVDTVGASDSALRTTSVMEAPNRAIINFAYNFNGSSIGSGVLRNNVVAKNAPINIYPNPAKNLLNITDLAENDRIMLFNLMGAKVMDHIATGASVNQIFIAELTAGHYLLQVSDNKGVVKARMPVQKL